MDSRCHAARKPRRADQRAGEFHRFRSRREPGDDVARGFRAARVATELHRRVRAEHGHGRLGHREARLHVECPDAVTSVFDVDELGDAMKARLGCAVDESPAALAGRCRRRRDRGLRTQADVDATSLPDHHREHEAGKISLVHEVAQHALLELLEAEPGETEHQARTLVDGVVQQQVDAAPTCQCLLHDRVQRGPVEYVHHQRQCFATRGMDGRSRGLETARHVDLPALGAVGHGRPAFALPERAAGDGDVEAFAREAQGRSLANAARGARDEGDPVRMLHDPSRHRCSGNRGHSPISREIGGNR